LSELGERLRRESHKLTGPRQSILGVLRQHARPLSNKQIHAALAGGECDLATVYRSMRLLEKIGIVKRFDFGDGRARYELLRNGDDGHHHHLVCTRCAEVVELHECFTRELEERIATRNGFQAVTHRLEFFGVCPACQ
jgi:Fur family ferric uptake transcriptional regulator